jgi:hypothetical protein
MRKRTVWIVGFVSLLAAAGCARVDRSLPSDGRWAYAFPATPKTSELCPVELKGLRADATTLTGQSFVVYSSVGGPADDDDWNIGRPLAVSNAAGQFPAKPTWEHEDPGAEVSAYYHLQRYLDFYRSLGFRGFAQPLNVAVNFRPGGDGNFLAGATVVRGGPGLVVGQWGDRNLAYDPDVLGHELFHVVHGQIVPDGQAPEVENELDALGLNTAPMAVAEAAADYFSCTLSGDPDVGEYTAPVLGLPFLSTLANGARFPQHRTGAAHADGQALSGALWEVRTLVGAGALDQALYDALVAARAKVQSMRGVDERRFTFPLLVDLILANLRQRAEPAAVERAREVFAARGLMAPSDVVALEPGKPRTLWIPGIEDPYGNVTLPPAEMPAPLQLCVLIPPDATGIAITLGCDAEGDDEEDAERRHRGGVAALRVCLRVAEPVRYAFRAGTLAVETDLLATTPTGVIELARAQVERLRGHKLHLSITNSSDDDLELRVTAAIER